MRATKMKIKILAGAVLSALLSTAAWADNVLILGGEGDSHVSVQAELEAAGHTVTYNSGTVLPGDISGYQQIWDMRLGTAISESDITAYDTFLKNSGYLYLTGEHSGFATRNNSISAFTNTLGGGTITVDGRAEDEQDAADGFFSNTTTVEYAAAAIITVDEGGTARILSTDNNGDPTGIMYIGNAGDLGEEYNGTVVVIADVNWTQSSYVDADDGRNRVFLQELIGGIAAGTVGGTIDETGNGDAAEIGNPTVEQTIITSEMIETVNPTSNNSPIGEDVTKALDSNSGTKYLNFDKETAGFTIKLNEGKVLTGVKITTANDFELRDPTKFTIYGSNDGVTWTEVVVDQEVTLPSTRNAEGDLVEFTNTDAYVYYFIQFTELKSTGDASCANPVTQEEILSCDSVQVSGVDFYYDANSNATAIDEGTGTIANPGTAGATSTMNTDPIAVSTSTETEQTSQTVTAGETVINTTVTRGSTVRVTTVDHDVSETETEQTVEQTTTHTDTTPVTTTIVETTPITTETCTAERTVTTYDDNSTTASDWTETCSSTTTDSVVTTENTVDEVIVTPIIEVFTGRIDQLATAQDITSSITRGLVFGGLQGIRSDHKYDNGMSGSTSGFSLGGTITNDNGIILGGGIANFSTDIADEDNNSATATTTVLDGSIGRVVDQGTVTFGLRHGMTDYTMGRVIGPWTNTGKTSGTDTSVRLIFEGNGERLKPVIGYTRGKRTDDAYVEGGSSLTARSVAESSEMYGYATIGGTLDLGLLDVTALHHTDGVNQGSIGLVKETGNVNWELRVDKTMTDLGDTTSVKAGFSLKF